MRNTFDRCAARIVLMIAPAAFSITHVSAGPILGTNGSTFAILGGAGVAVSGTGSVITGSVGGCCNATSVTGYPGAFTDSGGTVYDTGTLPTATETGGQADLLAAINALNALGPVTAESTLNGKTLTPGYYSIGATTLTGTLTLNAEGNSNALFVIFGSSSLTTDGGSDVQIINDGSGAGIGVYWVMTASAFLGNTTGDSTFYGNILANGTITLGSGVTDSCGSLLTQVDSVTLAGADTVGIGCQNGGSLVNGVITALPSSAVPEPSTLFLLAPGLAGLVILRSRLAK